MRQAEAQSPTLSQISPPDVGPPSSARPTPDFRFGVRLRHRRVVLRAPKTPRARHRAGRAASRLEAGAPSVAAPPCRTADFQSACVRRGLNARIGRCCEHRRRRAPGIEPGARRADWKSALPVLHRLTGAPTSSRLASGAGLMPASGSVASAEDAVRPASSRARGEPAGSRRSQCCGAGTSSTFSVTTVRRGRWGSAPVSC